MSDRKTMLAIDKDGRYCVAIHKEEGRTYTDEEILRLFIYENSIYEKVEVVEVDETVDCARRTESIG